MTGLQLDIDSFIRFRKLSGGFGLLTALIPLVVGTVGCVLLDGSTMSLPIGGTVNP